MDTTPETIQLTPIVSAAISIPGPQWGAAHGGEKLPPLPIPPPVSRIRRNARTIGIGALIVAVVVAGLAILFVGFPPQHELIAYDGSLSSLTIPFPQDASCFSQRDGYHVIGSHMCFTNVSGATFTVKASQISGALDHSYGIIFDYTDAYHYYRFFIRGNGEWGFQKVIGGASTFPVSGQANSAIHRGLNVVNELEVKPGTSSTDFSINGTEVGQGDTTEFDSGQWGLSGNSDIEVVYSYLKVTESA